MDWEANDFTALEQERENLYNLIDQNKEKPLSSDSLVQQSRKLDDMIASIQKDWRFC